MTTIARTVMNFNEIDQRTMNGNNLDLIAYQKNQDYENERTYWIFTDGSAVWLDSMDHMGIIAKYGTNKDHEWL